MTMMTEQPRTVVLAATDGSSVSDDVIRSAAEIAANAPRGELHLVHILQPMPKDIGGNVLMPPVTEFMADGQELLSEAKSKAAKFCARPIETHLLVGDPWREIVELGASLSADLIVVGSHQRKGIERFLLGSVSEQVVRRARCQVLVARPKEHEVASSIPEIEPPCKECLEVQSATSGEKRWCPQHEHRSEHARARLHYETAPTFAVGSMLLRPEQ